MFKFGFREVKEEEKQGLVSSVFNSVANKYDLMNNIMSFGMQKLWKKNFCDLIHIKEGGKYLDLAGGNGDISNLVLEKAKQENKNIQIVLCDASEEMLELAKKRFNGNPNISFALSFAESLPFNEGEFDGVFISFGIRNFTNIPTALNQISNTLKSGGSLFCLEFFSDVSGLFGFDKIYKQYLLKGIPVMGKLVAKDEQSYKYFGESILNFHSKQEFEDVVKKANFKLFSKTDGMLSIVTFFHFKK